jgi:hypothetical protein
MLGLGNEIYLIRQLRKKKVVATSSISGVNGVVKTQLHHLFWQMTTKQNQNIPQTLYQLLVFFQILVLF